MRSKAKEPIEIRMALRSSHDRRSSAASKAS
jgi:hypothetical protein